MEKSKTAHCYIQNGPRTKTAHGEVLLCVEMYFRACNCIVNCTFFVSKDSLRFFMNNILQFSRFALCIMYYKFLVLLCVEMYLRACNCIFNCTVFLSKDNTFDTKVQLSRIMNYNFCFVLSVEICFMVCRCKLNSAFLYQRG